MTLLALDRPEWIHCITAHPRSGAPWPTLLRHHSNRARVTTPSHAGDSAGSAADAHPEKENSDFSKEARRTWARLLKEIFEIDPLLCTCGTRMRIVSFITDPRVVDRILRHRESERCKVEDPFEPRAPARTQASSRQ